MIITNCIFIWCLTAIQGFPTLVLQTSLHWISSNHLEFGKCFRHLSKSSFKYWKKTHRNCHPNYSSKLTTCTDILWQLPGTVTSVGTWPPPALAPPCRCTPHPRPPVPRVWTSAWPIYTMTHQEMITYTKGFRCFVQTIYIIFSFVFGIGM